MADRPLPEIGGRTPLQAARTPAMDEIAGEGRLGLINNFAGKKFGMNSDVCIMSLLGYDPSKFYSGRGPLEAASMGIPLGENQSAFRCNLASISENILIDYSSGHITTKEAGILISALNRHFKGRGIRFYPGVSYRHIAVVDTDRPLFKDAGIDGIICSPPHDVVGMKLDRVFPRGKGADVLIKIMKESVKILEEHDVNYVRKQLDENPGNIAWLWGQGRTPSFSPFPVRGAAISAVDVVKGISKCAGLDVIDVPGATGYFDTDYAAKGRRAAELLESYDFVLVHVEAPDEAGHMGMVYEKIRAIENFDGKVVKPVLEHLKKTGGYRLAVLPDHATPISVKTHAPDPIPFAFCGEGVEQNSGKEFNEKSARKTGLYIQNGHKFMGDFLKLS